MQIKTRVFFSALYDDFLDERLVQGRKRIHASGVEFERDH